MKNLQFDAIIEKAIANEEEARLFYSNLAEKVTDKATQDTLLYLAAEEGKHKEFLLRYRRDNFISEAGNAEQAVGDKIAAFLAPPEVNYNMDSKDVYLLAAARELKSYNFYQAMAGLHPAGEIKTMLLKMAAQELMHKEKVEYLYSNTAFAQTAGG